MSDINAWSIFDIYRLWLVISIGAVAYLLIVTKQGMPFVIVSSRKLCL